MTKRAIYVRIELVGRTYKKDFKTTLFLIIGVGFLSFATNFLISCGTETTYYLDPSTKIIHEPNQDTVEADAYFEFVAKSSSDQSSIDGGFKYQGTAVYYKIYNNYSEIENRWTSINKLNESDNEASAAQSVISYGYKPLGTNAGEEDPLIGDNGGTVKIRLFNYLETQLSGEEYEKYERRAYIKINGVQMFLPLRAEGKFTFDFGRKETEINLVPSASIKVGSNVKNITPDGNNDSDAIGDVYKSGSFSSGKCWYVDMYAFSVGHDNNFTKYYSKVLHLGCVKIDAAQDYK